MTQMRVADIVRTRGQVEILDRHGKLVYRSRETRLFGFYEQWRVQWATANRGTWMPPGFRSGRLNPLTVGFYLYLWIFQRNLFRRLRNE